MFDGRLEAALGDPRALIDLADEAETGVRQAGCAKLRVAAAWADAHSGVDHPDGGPATEQLVRLGPVGCPPVAETCPASLAQAFRTSVVGAKGWLGDALNLRHRLPRLWARVTAGEVYAWKAREIAAATAHLNPLTARIVDKLLHGQVELMAWARFVRILDATLLQVDPKTYAERAAKAAAQRDVRATQSSDGLRTLIARATAGDVTMFLALVDAIAEALADEGDEDPYPVRKSKAIGIAAYPERALELLTRGRHREDPHREPWEQEAAHCGDPTDPWADDLPDAGWQSDRHGNYHQPTLDDGADACGARVEEPSEDWPADPPIDDADYAWYLRHRADPAGAGGAESAGGAEGMAGAEGSRSGPHRDSASPAEKSGDTDHPDQQRRPEPPRRWPNTGGLDLRPTAFGDLSTAGPTAIIHLHLTDTTVREGRGVIRTEYGPITVDQLRSFLGEACPSIKVYPVFDPAATAAVDAYEIPIAVRRAVAIRHPGSVFPFSPCTSRRMDLDHSTPYEPGGPPGQTGPDTLGPLARTEHRPKTVGRWRVRQPDPGLYVWRSPEGWITLTTNQGTLLLGDTPYTRTLWQAARTASESAASP